jgi:hypothetical protein
VNPKFNVLVERGQSYANRLLHQELNLAITGFSGAGKSSFITSLVNQIIYANKYQNLPFWRVMEEGRFVAAAIDDLPDSKVRRFDYATNRLRLAEGLWPESTTHTSGLTVSIKYQISNRLLASVKKISTLKLNIYDYPGEWLLDLILLKQSYRDWNQYALTLLRQEPELYQRWLNHLEAELKTAADIPRLSRIYTDFLKQLKQRGLLVSPGRFVLPVDLEATPILEFFPLSEPMIAKEGLPFEEIVRKLEQKYYQFKSEVISPFFENYFQKVDRQILLVDCIALIKQRAKNAHYMAEAIEKLSDIFCYGESKFWDRLWKPKIDKVLIVATKADQIPSDQQYRLQTLLSSLFYPTHNKLKFLETQVDFLTMSAIKCTEPVVAEIEGKNLHCIKGVLQENGETMVVYPGSLPQRIEDIKTGEFDLPDYRPPELKTEVIPHIRMGKVLEFITGDILL